MRRSSNGKTGDFILTLWLKRRRDVQTVATRTRGFRVNSRVL